MVEQLVSLSITQTADRFSGKSASTGAQKRSWQFDPSICHDLYPEAGQKSLARPPGNMISFLSSRSNSALEANLELRSPTRPGGVQRPLVWVRVREAARSGADVGLDG
jgi:hypothetical protein